MYGDISFFEWDKMSARHGMLILCLALIVMTTVPGTNRINCTWYSRSISDCGRFDC